jgi:hypothetical protein
MNPGEQPFKRYDRWTKTSASDQNRLRAAVEALRRAAVSEGTAQQIIAGVPVDVAPEPDEFWLELLAPPSGGAYLSWVEVAQDGLGGFVTPADPMQGAAGFPAFELNGREDAPLNTPLRAWLSKSEPLCAVFDSAGEPPLTVMEDDGAPIVTDVSVLQFHAPPFIVVQAAVGTADVFPRFGTDIQSVGAANWPGDSGLFTQSNHIHANVLPPCASIRFPECGQLCYTPGSSTAQIWDCDFNQWIVLCCTGSGTGTGTGSGSGGCTPGVCADCTNPPYQWGLNVSGFGGPCAVFNGGWTLKNTDACTWVYATRVDGLTVALQIVVSGAAATLTLEAVDAATLEVVAEATYAGTISGKDCCSSVVFSKVSCSCDPVGEGCPRCSGPTPTTWTVTVAGATNTCAEFNGTWTLTGRGGACAWGTRLNPRSRGFILWRPADPASGLTGWALQFSDIGTPVGPGALYQTGGPLLIDCCAAQTVSLVSAHGAGGDGFFGSCDMPATLTVTPDAPECDDPPTSCPATITGKPLCCGGGGGACPCAIPTKLFAQFSGGGGCLDGVTLELDFTSGYTWAGLKAVCGGATLQGTLVCNLDGSINTTLGCTGGSIGGSSCFHTDGCPSGTFVLTFACTIACNEVLHTYTVIISE